MKSIGEILILVLKIIFIPITMWTPAIREDAEKQAEVLSSIPPKKKTPRQNNFQTKLSDMIEDYDDLNSD